MVLKQDLWELLSLKDSNWRGKNQELGFTFEKSNKDYTSFSLDFFDPWIRNTDRVSWDGDYTRQAMEIAIVSYSMI